MVAAPVKHLFPKQRIDGSSPFSRSNLDFLMVWAAISAAFPLPESGTICFLSSGIQLHIDLTKRLKQPAVCWMS